MKSIRPITLIGCLVVAFMAHAGERPIAKAKAKAAVNPPSAAELQPLQGTWEGIFVEDQGPPKTTPERKPDELDIGVFKIKELSPPPKPAEKITLTVTGDSLHFYRDTNFWFRTTITLPPGTDPQQFHATIKECPPSQSDSIGQVVGAIFKIEDGTLTLADYTLSDEPPKTFANAKTRYVLKHVPSQQKPPEPLKPKDPKTP